MGLNQYFRGANFITWALLHTLLIFMDCTDPIDSPHKVLFERILYVLHGTKSEINGI